MSNERHAIMCCQNVDHPRFSNVGVALNVCFVTFALIYHFVNLLFGILDFSGQPATTLILTLKFSYFVF